MLKYKNTKKKKKIILYHLEFLELMVNSFDPQVVSELVAQVRFPHATLMV